MTSKKSKAPKTRKFVQDLPVALKAFELQAKQEELVVIEQRIDALALERSKVLEGLNDRKTKLDLDRKTLLEALTSKTEKRAVDCEARVDFERNREVIVRVDTGEQLEERALTGDERDDLAQASIFSDGEEKQRKPEPRV